MKPTEAMQKIISGEPYSPEEERDMLEIIKAVALLYYRRDARLFSVWCARYFIKANGLEDEWLTHALNTAEEYARFKGSDKDRWAKERECMYMPFKIRENIPGWKETGPLCRLIECALETDEYELPEQLMATCSADVLTDELEK